MKVLVANIGSTSLKWRLFELSNGPEQMLHKGGFERVSDYPKAIEECLAQLLDSGHIHSEKDLAAVGFKTVAAKGVTGCVRLDETVLKAMEAFNGIAPAHNPPYIVGIRLFAKRMPGVPLVGLFETACHQYAPEAIMRYAVPDQWTEAGVRRWGYHGASHKFIAERSAQLLGREDVAQRAQNLYTSNDFELEFRKEFEKGSPNLRVISCHLGGSSSITGIFNGVSVGNSMGMSPQSGLPNNNRVGELDSFAIPFVMRTLGLSLEEVERQLCKESGLKGISGLSNDFRDIKSAAAQGNEKAKLAIDVFVASVKHWIGAFLAQMNGTDALVFTAGIGENNPDIRAAICADLDQLGIELDSEKNAKTRVEEAVISRDGARVKIMVIPTNEELVVAREVRRLLTNESRNLKLKTRN
ncbi:MAG TPA: acetate kinase [Verrucomicrobiae bacterium]|nr:acetate kinase [Verrucomicrobiae bacterium]